MPCPRTRPTRTDIRMRIVCLCSHRRHHRRRRRCRLRHPHRHPPSLAHRRRRRPPLDPAPTVAAATTITTAVITTTTCAAAATLGATAATHRAPTATITAAATAAIIAAVAAVASAALPLTGPPALRTTTRDGVDVFDYHFKESTVCARCFCMRTPVAERRSKAPLISPAHPHLALQRSADHLPRILRLCLHVRSFRHLLWLWRCQHYRARRTRLGAAYCRSNAPGIAPARLSHAEKP